MKDIDFLLNHIKEQIDRASKTIEINIILSDYQKEILKNNWDYIQAELTKHITISNFIMYSLEKDSKGRNILNIKF